MDVATGCVASTGSSGYAPPDMATTAIDFGGNRMPAIFNDAQLQKRNYRFKDGWSDEQIRNLHFYRPAGHRYAPQWVHDRHKNDEGTQRVLRLKSGDAKAIQYYADLLDDLLCRDIAVAVVPRHDPSLGEGGCHALAKRIARQGRIDASSVLVRTKKIIACHAGGDRGSDVHLQSISVTQPHLVKGRAVVVIDDITTSGGSLEVCRGLLCSAGATRVKMLAMAKTKS